MFVNLHKKLSHKQKRFCTAFVGKSGLNSGDAAEAAGYARSAGWRLLSNEDVRSYIDLLLEDDPLVMSSSEVCRQLTSIARDENKKEKTGDRLKALDMLAKTKGQYITNVNHTGDSESSAGITINVQVRENSVRVRGQAKGLDDGS